MQDYKKLDMTCQQQIRNQHIQVKPTKLWKTEAHCDFEYCKVSVEEVKTLLLSINNDKPPGSDNLDGKLLRIIPDDIATSSI